jgi:hypothetical protein
VTIGFAAIRVRAGGNEKPRKLLFHRHTSIGSNSVQPFTYWRLPGDLTMTAVQYEELCRFFVADLENVPLEDIQSIELLNPQRLGAPEYVHQIDLYWETVTPLSRYVNIAYAKWRRPADRVDKEQVLLLQVIRAKVGAHKAIMLTNTGFTRGAIAAAVDDGIGLHIVEPRLAAAVADGDRPTIRASLREQARRSRSRPIYLHQVVFKGGVPPAAATPAAPPGDTEAASHRVATAAPFAGASGPPVPPATTPAPYATRHGVPGMRTKG